MVDNENNVSIDVNAMTFFNKYGQDGSKTGGQISKDDELCETQLTN